MRCSAAPIRRNLLTRPAPRAQAYPSTVSVASEDQHEGDSQGPCEAAMSEQVAAAEQQLTLRQRAAIDRSPPMRVDGKLRKACMALVHDGLGWKEAAERAGFRPSSMLSALERPHVKAFIKQQRDVLRSSMCGRNILVLAEVRDQTDNQMARVQAVKALEQLEDQQVARGPAAAMPGLTIHVHQVQASASKGITIDVSPTDSAISDQYGATTIEQDQ